MLICGVKVSHDGGVAVVDDGRLLFSTEVEKIANQPRYSTLGDLARVPEILAREGIDPSDVDRFVVDGWYGSVEEAHSVIRTLREGEPVNLPVAPYEDRPGFRTPITRYLFDTHAFSGTTTDYSSYHHVDNHLLGGYCSSPFAAAEQDALVLVWDGSVAPRLYHVEAATRGVTAVATLFPLTGNAFADFSGQFGPFRWDITGLTDDEVMRHHLSIAGKAMAYAALGTVHADAFPVFDEIITAFPSVSAGNGKTLGEKVAGNRDQLFPGLTDADLIATFQAYLGKALLDGVLAALRRTADGRLPNGARAGTNLVLAGGCALNIKWNNAFRASGAFTDVWVPPFANDSGAAIGTACCEMFHEEGRTELRWDVFSGPHLTAGEMPPGWRSRPCDEHELARLLHTEGEPVVVLSGRAEIGPRALGNRSILAPATSPSMKQRLNDIKDRAAYRPVAPICLTSRAADVFDPGGSDPYMLFEHRLRPGWAERVPAVVHLDGTARLQTIDPSAGTATSRILAAYAELSGIPVLCNTSANLNGSGFFPDVASAARWGGTRYIWSEGLLHINPADHQRR